MQFATTWKDLLGIMLSEVGQTEKEKLKKKKKNLTTMQETWDSIPGSGRSPGKKNCNSLQYFCLENSMDRGAWQDTVHGVAKSKT